MKSCQLREYIDLSLSDCYTKVGQFSKTAFSTVECFKHNETGNKLVKIISYNRNDHVYRKLEHLSSPNLPKIYTVCSDDEYLCVLEEFIDGKTLAEVAGDSTIPLKTACQYMCDVCSGLSQLHNENIIHRDIKPSNIIITPSGTAVIIDFGIARLTGDNRLSDTQNLGTAGYAAPEQFGITQSSPETDIYPIGVILNELVLGVHPTVDIPKGKIGKIITRCTSTQMSKRYHTVNELRNALVKLTR